MREKRRYLRLQQRPIFTGNGLLISAGASAFTVLASGVALSVLYPQKQKFCEPSIDGGEDYCYTDQKYYEWEAFSVSMFSLGTVAATTIGITGSVLRGYYDAWRTENGHRRPLPTRLYFAVGGSLLALSGILVAATITTFFADSDQAYEIGAPLLGAASVLSATSGLSLVTYGASYLIRTRRLRNFSLLPFVQPHSRRAGLSISGRF